MTKNDEAMIKIWQEMPKAMETAPAAAPMM